MKIKVEPFLMKQGNKVAKAAIEFDGDGDILSGFHLVGFTICEDADKDLFVLFPASIDKTYEAGVKKKAYFFLRPNNDDLIDKLETAILDKYEDMVGSHSKIGK